MYDVGGGIGALLIDATAFDVFRLRSESESSAYSMVFGVAVASETTSFAQTAPVFDRSYKPSRYIPVDIDNGC